MPIVTVELVGEEQRDREASLAQSLANAIATALHSGPGQTWVRVRWLRPNDYAENGSSVSSGDLPVFVGIVKRLVPVVPELEAEISELTRVIAQEVRRPPQSVHIEYAPSAAGRLSFGGSLMA
jgi:phenylpyruvate tautomerase PptA (4-oxalocrotonate tautomerase family)